jgi:hypothetical protein
MREMVLPVLQACGLALLERDVRDDPALSRRYLLQIPVLLWGDHEVARHRVSEDTLRARLRDLGLVP